ncbi:MAG: ABC transporter permease [Lachnospiraceae bacterium]|nr:ABC transporter permease [Lachnospiraceae bacterium]
MKNKDTLRLVIWNIFSRRRRTIRFAGELLFLSIAVVSWLTMFFFFRNYRKSFERYSAANCYILASSDPAQEAEEYRLSEENSLSMIRKMDGASEEIAVSVPDLVEVLEKKEQWIFVNNERVQMVIGEERYQGKNDYSFDFRKEKWLNYLKEEYTVPFEIMLAKGDSFPTAKMLRGFQSRYNDDPIVLYGKGDLVTNGLLVTDYVLKTFGVPKDKWNSIIGRHVSLYAEGEEIVSDVVLSGILDSRLYYLNGWKDYPQVILTDSEFLSEKFGKSTWSMVYFDSYEQLGNALSESNHLDCNFRISCMGELGQSERLSGIQMVINKILSVVAVIMVAVVFINLCSVIISDVEKRIPYWGMQKALGMGFPDILKVTFLEILFLALFTTTVSALISPFIVREVCRFLELFSDYQGTMEWTTLPGVILGTSLGISGMVLLIEIPALFPFYKREPVELMKHRRDGQ